MRGADVSSAQARRQPRCRAAERTRRPLPFVSIAVFTLCTSLHAGSQITASHAAIATSSPLATQIGVRVLKDGGSAADAAVAVALLIGVAQPESSGIGGGGMLTYYESKTGAIWTLDFLPTAPAAVKPEMAGTRTGVKAAGTPGLLAGLDVLHRKFGLKPWKSVVEPAIVLAREGGNKDLAATLTRVSEAGARDFYDGETGNRIASKVKDAGGVLGFQDLRTYAAIWRAPMRIEFNGYDIYVPPAPSTGAIIIGETLNMLSTYDLAASGFQTTKTIHLLSEALRRASIDASHYIGDPASARIPYRDLLSSARADAWRKTIVVDHFTPAGSLTEPDMTPPASGHTTHITIADSGGNVVSMTLTLGDESGSGFVVPGTGVLMNDALAAFTSKVPNALEGGKRSRTPLSPAIILKDNHPVIAIGTPGGDAIPSSILQVLLNVIVYKKTFGEAIAAPRIHQSEAPDDMDYERALSKETISALAAIGQPTNQRETIGDVEALMFDGGNIIAVSDPRHRGAAGGF
jgi:gamma-glutamyltranspeptidase/glutathione hydrolase